MSKSLTFDPAKCSSVMTQECLNLTLPDDGSVEMNQRTILSLVDTTNEQIMLNGATRNIDIEDNDSNNEIMSLADC